MMVERLHILMTLIWVYVSQAVSGLQHLGSLWKTWEETRVVYSAELERCLPQEKTDYAENIFWLWVSLPWIPVLSLWVISSTSEYPASNTGHFPGPLHSCAGGQGQHSEEYQWNIMAGVWLLVWIYLTPRMVFLSKYILPSKPKS